MKTSSPKSRKPIPVEDLTGQTFGSWVVLSRVIKTGSDGAVYACRCVCGVEKEVTADTLRRGTSKSCGCTRKRDFCPKGHSIAIAGRTPDGSCRLCIKSKRISKLYGITFEEYTALWDFQDGRCAICGIQLQAADYIGAEGWYDPGVRVEIDHDHADHLTPRQAVRGLLCGGRWKGCNRKLGNMDNLDWLRKVVKYLEAPPAQSYIRTKVTP